MGKGWLPMRHRRRQDRTPEMRNFNGLKKIMSTHSGPSCPSHSQRPSMEIGHPRSSEVIRGHPRSSEDVLGRE
jgi:hypothetical protein